MSMCRVFSCVVGRGCLVWPVCSCREPPGYAPSLTRPRDERGPCKAALGHMRLPRGPNMPPRESLGSTQTTTRSQDERGTCKAALPLGVVPGAWHVSFLLLLLGFLLIFGNVIRPPWKSPSLFRNAHDCSGSGHDHKDQVKKEKATSIVWLLA